MGRFDDLRQKAGIPQPTGKVITKRPERVEISTRAVAPAPVPPAPPTFTGSLPSFDITQSPLMRTIQAQPVTSRPTIDVETRARQLPVIGPVLKGLDIAAQKTEPLAALMRSFYTPGAGAANLAGLTRAAGTAVSKALPGLGATTAGKVGKAALTEGIVGAPLGAAQTQMISPDASVGELAKGAALGAGLGGLVGGAAPLVGKGVKSLRDLAARRTGITEPLAQPTLALPQGRGEARISAAMERSRLAPSEEPIISTGRVRTPEPIGLPEPTIGEPTRARVETRPNIYTQKLENLFETANRMRFTPGKELEELESLWSQIAEPRDPNLSELIDLAYPKQVSKVSPTSLSQARELQRAREVAGVPSRVKGLEERYQPFSGDVGLPRERVGFRQPQVEVIPPTRKFAPTGKKGKAETIPVRPTGAPQVAAEVPAVVQRAEVPTQPSRPLTATSTPEEVLQAVQQPRVRDRVYNFLDEQEQAAKERINKRRNIGFVPTGGNEAVDWAIIGAAKLGKGTIKSADWTEEMVKELGEVFRQHAPKIYQQSKELLRRQERIASKEGQAADAFNAGAGNAASFEQKISRQVNQRKKTWDQKTEQARTQFTDRRAALEGLEIRATGKVASAESSLYKASRLFSGVSEKANQIITDRLTPIIKGVENAKYTSDDLGRYALAQHARDVNNAGYKSGFTNAEIDDVIRQYENIPEMEQARQQLVQVSNDLLDSLVDSQVISAQLRDTLKERWKNYIPLFRSFEDDPETFAAGLGQSLKSIGDPIKALKGSERAVIDPLENMVKSIYQSVTASERNKVKLQLSNLAKADPNENYIRKLTEDEAVGKKNVVPVRENGKTIRYEVEPEVYKAFAGLDDESSNLLMKVLAAPASVLRAGATLTPDFALRNPMRDVVQAFITSKSGFNPVIDFPIGLFETVTKGKYYKDWVDNLGAYGNTLSMDRDMHREALKEVLKESASKKFVNVISGKALVKLMRTITDTTESATKVGEFRKAIKKGETPQEAAYRARDLMDFARAGTSIKPANRIISFLNANIQGKSKLLRSIKENPASTLTKMFTGVTVPTIGIYAWNHNQANETQRQTIDEAPDWQKDAFWMLAVPGTDMVARIPKPFDVAPVFANLPERVLDSIYRSNPVEMDEWIKNTLKESALPTQISGLLPLIEGMSGYSFFRQGDIVPEREKGLQLKDQYDPVRTSEVAKLLASGVRSVAGEGGTFKNFGSPRIMENTIKGFTAGLGTYATDAVDSLLKGPNVPFTGGKKLYPPLIERPIPPEKRAEQSPFTRSFLVDPLGATKSMDRMYREIDKLSREESSRQLRGEEPSKIGKKTVHLSPEKAKQLITLQDVSKDISEINKSIRAIESDKVKTAKQKRSEIEPLLAKRNQLSIEVMKNQKR